MSLEKIHSHLRAHVHHRLSFLAVAAALALVLNLVNAQVRALAQEQAPSGNITAPAVQPELVQPQPAPQAPDQGKEMREDGNGEQPEDFVDPREILNALRDIKRQKVELRNLLRQITRLKNVVGAVEMLAKVKELSDQLAGFEANIKNPPGDMSQRGALQEYWDARVWESFEELRTRIQLPREVQDGKKALSKVEKMLKLKSFLKLGLNMAKLQELVEKIKSIYSQVEAALAANDFEGARDAMQDIWEGGMHPGGLEGALHRIRGIKDMLRSIKDKQITAAVEELLQPIYDALYEGDFNEVHNVLNEYEDDLRRLANQIIRSRLKFNKVESKISNLEELIRGRFEALEQQAQEKENQRQAKEAPQESNPSPAPQPAPTQ